MRAALAAFRKRRAQVRAALHKRTLNDGLCRSSLRARNHRIVSRARIPVLLRAYLARVVKRTGSPSGGGKTLRKHNTDSSDSWKRSKVNGKLALSVY